MVEHADGRVRAVIAEVAPAIGGGRFPVKRTVDEPLEVTAVCFADGHDALRVRLRWRAEHVAQWQEVEMTAAGNDRWHASVVLATPGRYRYGVTAWVDALATWRSEFARREDAADLRLAARTGAALIRAAAARAGGAGGEAGRADRERLLAWAAALEDAVEPAGLRRIALDDAAAGVAARHPERTLQASWPVELPLTVDRLRARYSSWYEFFPRSAAPAAGRHGTLADALGRLDYIAGLGFDVVYLPPIHPIGRLRRKGRNNRTPAQPGDVGSPWAIGASEGGHQAIHPELGTLEDLRRLVARARELDMEIALDIALQCAPDHPWVAAHPLWFRHRADGSVQYAENPPKKYEDIYPLDFETPDWRALWEELAGVFEFWIAQGVRIFRVDNPHTKPFAFWEWLIERIGRAHPDVIFLAEAFTRPAVMHHLARLGFSQSYTYFAWRNTRSELTDYFTELAHGPGRDYLRPNAWPNTPDILPEALQYGGRAAFAARLVLAATLSASYGIYGPAFELMEHAAREPGSEEYLDSEKYQLRHWPIDRPDSLAPLVALLNGIRRENPALQSNDSLCFLVTDNEQLVCYAKRCVAPENTIVVVVDLDPEHAHGGWVELDLQRLGIAPDLPYQMHDLLSGARYLWHGPRNYVRLDPARMPAHVLRVRRRLRSEHDFDYFL